MLAHVSRRARLVAALAAAALVGGLLAAGGPAGASSSSELSSVIARLNQVQSSLGVAQGTAARLAAEVSGLSGRLAVARAQVRQDQAQVVGTRLVSQSAAATLAGAQARVRRLAGLVQGQARAAYIAGDLPTALAALASSSSVTDLFDRMAVLNYMAQQGQAQLAELQAAQQEAAASAARYLAAARAAVAAVRTERRVVARLTALRAGRERAEAAFRGRITLLAHESAALRARSAELHGLITQEQSVQQQVGNAGTVSGGGGGLCPLAGVPAAQVWIIMHESGDNPRAQNPVSTAFGLGQLLLGNRIAFLGPNYATTNCALQLQAMTTYIRERYGTPEAAQAFWEAHDWY